MQLAPRDIGRRGDLLLDRQVHLPLAIFQRLFPRKRRSLCLLGRGQLGLAIGVPHLHRRDFGLPLLRADFYLCQFRGLRGGGAGGCLSLDGALLFGQRRFLPGGGILPRFNQQRTGQRLGQRNFMRTGGACDARVIHAPNLRQRSTGNKGERRSDVFALALKTLQQLLLLARAIATPELPCP